MNRQAIFDRIEVAKQELREAEASVGKALRELKVNVRADKAIIGEALEAAISKMKLASKDLAALEQLIGSALD